MRYQSARACAIVSLLCLFVGRLCATETLAGRPFWMSVGLGAVKAPGCSNGWLAYHFGANWRQGVGFVSIQTVGGTEVDPFNTVEPEESAVDLGVLYGLRTSGRAAFASASAGVAVVTGTKRGKVIDSSCGFGFSTTTYESEPFTTVGFPLKLQLGLIASDDFGLGMDVVGDINSQRSYYGAVISLMLGQLR